MQSTVLEAMVRAVDSVRETYGVSDYRWFDLRDSSTADPSIESHYGITRDDYSPKPAYDVYRGLIAELGGSAGAAPPRPRAASLVAKAGRCVAGHVKLTLARRSGRRVGAVTVHVGRRVPRLLAVSLPTGRARVRVLDRAVRGC